MKRLKVLAEIGGTWFPNSSLGMTLIPKKFSDVEGLYSFIGAEPYDSESEMKAKAREKLKETHPDKGGNLEDFLKAKEAYTTLSDPTKRARYDRRTEEPVSGLRIAYSGPQEVNWQGLFDESPEGKPGFYKEPQTILSPEEVERVYSWIETVLKKAQELHVELEVKVGMHDSPTGFFIDDDILFVGREEEPNNSHAAVYILKHLCAEAQV